MARLILVRHGQTEWNRVERFRGQIDLPLNETGLRQAEQAARRIAAAYEVAAIYSSPLARAAKTAEAIGEAVRLPVQILPGINDFNFGQWEGRSLQEVAEATPELFRLWQTHPHLAAIPGGEKLEALRARVVGAVERVAAEHPSETVVMVSHRMVCKSLACYMLGLDDSHLWRVELDTASISLFEKRRSHWVTLLLNDCHHLESLALPGS